MMPSGIRKKLRPILRLDEPAERLAASFSLGVFVAFTPVIGFHTVIVLVAAWATRLNKVVALTGTFINNPWTIIPVYVGPTWATAWFMRRVGMDMPPFSFDEVSSRFMQVVDTHRFYQAEFWGLLAELFRPYTVAFVSGTLIAGALAAAASYPLMFFAIKSYRIEREKLRAIVRERKKSGPSADKRETL